jgi:hypothetical protein
MTRSRVYDLLLITFILALLWAGLLRSVLTPLATHMSNFGAVGLVSLLLIRPRADPATRFRLGHDPRVCGHDDPVSRGIVTTMGPCPEIRHAPAH